MNTLDQNLNLAITRLSVALAQARDGPITTGLMQNIRDGIIFAGRAEEQATFEVFGKWATAGPAPTN